MATVFDPIKIGNVEIKNRLAVAATVKNIAEQNGLVGTRILENYSIEADGPGLYIVSMTYTEDQGRVFKGQTGIHNDLATFGMAEVANRIHKAGGKTFLQLSHGGNLCSAGIIGETPVGPSSIPQWPGQTVRALSTEEVYKIADNFGKAIGRAKEAGFDGVELHSCHGSMMLQFLSKLHNKGREDIFANGEEFLYECFRKGKEYAGADFPIGVRLSCHEFMMEDKGVEGLDFEKVKEIVVVLEKMGAAYIHASAGRIGHTPDHAFPPLYDPRGVNLRFADEVKKLVKIPVITVGRYQDAKLIKKVVEDGKADIVAMCRPVIADPFISKKIIDGKDDSIRQCMGCNWCLEKLFNQVALECPMNPAYGWENEYALKPAETVKKVMIVGGGVAGLQAAYAAAIRGHRVSLYEKSDSLGGQIKFASQYPALYTRELWNLPRWLIKEIAKLPVDIHLNTEVDEDLINTVNPETIIFATGAVEKAYDFEGAGNPKVSYLWDYLAGKVELGKRVAVVGSEAVEAAASLCNEGKQVVLIQDQDDYIWPEYIPGGAARREPLSRMLKKADTKFNAKLKAVTDSGIKIAYDGKEEDIECDDVIIADGRTKVDDLYRKFVGKGRELYIVGDARDARTLLNASHEGYWAGRII
ncbi:MAG TPA: FAD-dependent oxidoreductase [Anaerovoracaceae bacterium]|nr:FAD-dependent oxidoreductase [Anaerovoracaceae bacterium]